MKPKSNLSLFKIQFQAFQLLIMQAFCMQKIKILRQKYNNQCIAFKLFINLIDQKHKIFYSNDEDMTRSQLIRSESATISEVIITNNGLTACFRLFKDKTIIHGTTFFSSFLQMLFATVQMDLTSMYHTRKQIIVEHTYDASTIYQRVNFVVEQQIRVLITR